MIRDLQDDHHSPDDFLLRRTLKFVTLGCLEMKKKTRGKEKNRRNEGVKFSFQRERDKADETPREEDHRDCRRKKDGYEAAQSDCGSVARKRGHEGNEAAAWSRE